jgi:gliding motility-associated lipoprotein GldK
MNAYLSSVGQFFVQDYRLPMESEWEYASRGGLDLAVYPWGGPYTRNDKGCFLANFKPMRGDYVDDGGLHTVEVAIYEANDYGLYDMAGNVSEWTANAFDESAYSFTHDMNPYYKYHALSDDPPAMKRKVVRGGSWKDIGYYLQNAVRTYEYQDTAKAYIGFRCVRSYMGPDETGAKSNVY